MTSCDFLIIGAGIAGASAAFELSAQGRVILLERESRPGYHSTGRSAALYTETYGNAAIRSLTVGSRPFFDATVVSGFSEHPVLTPRGVLLVGREEQLASLDEAFAAGSRLTPTIRRLDADAALAMAPMLRPDQVAGAVWEPDAMDMDVHAIHQGYLRGARARGAEVVTDAELTGLTRRDGVWRAETRTGTETRTWTAPWVVNAAGAWADGVAALAGLRPMGLTPKRRTAITFDPTPIPAEANLKDWPMVCDVDESFYFKPEGGRLLGSPADATPVEPCDIQPEELDIALAVDRIERAALFKVRRITHRWAGLRTFAPDMTPVVGPDPEAEGFFWLAGQGGYGIQTAPGMARTAAGLLTSGAVPEDLAALGVNAVDLAPERLRAP
ncbi:FAD-dependent oxidoreductase [Skermanella stibiiresistens SB22]|uniref:FAD-dependent oxidoreductase n=1 Tax=Skermanella stibiiresistens SB22 TaxID=1385369 RepID=W9GYQ3_9PROT|nr:FAD-dependent oxidoreductase [Skermanella stibiiresistens]EWY37721.1 FAD-dependent oxidoreductase [Skermanella stibiiresistens SB22]